MAIINASYVFSRWSEYKDFVFVLTASNREYICEYAPDGWEEPQIQTVRNRTAHGLMLTFVDGLTFEKADADWLRVWFNEHYFDGGLELKIYALNNTSMDYTLYHSGLVDFTHFSDNGYSFKVDLKENNLRAYVENFGDVEYSLDFSDLIISQPFYKNALYPPLRYDGIGIRETSFFTKGVNSVIEMQATVEPRYRTYFRPTMQVEQVDGIVTLKQETIAETFFPYDGTDWTGGNLPFFVADAYGGTLTIHCKIDFHFVSTNLVVSKFFGRIGINYPFTSYVDVFDLDVPNAFTLEDYSADFTTTITLGAFEEARIYFALDRTLVNTTDIVATECQMNLISFDVNYVGAVPQETLQGLRLVTTLELLLYKLTNHTYHTVTGLNMWVYRLTLINGNLLRGLGLKGSVFDAEPGTTYSFKTSLNDLLMFLVKKCGLGYNITDTTIDFDVNFNFFDAENVLTQITEPSTMVTAGFTDYFFSTVKAGDKPYNTEYLSGKYCPFEETEYQTETINVKNPLDLMVNISTNPFQIDENVRRGKEFIELTDFDGDYDVFCLYTKYVLDQISYIEIDKDNYNLVQFPEFPYKETIYNLFFTPFRQMYRYMTFLQVTGDQITVTKRTKFEDFTSAFTDDHIAHENGVYPFYYEDAHGNQMSFDLPPLKILPYSYELEVPTGFMIGIFNRFGLILFVFDGIRYAGYLDDVSYNRYTGDKKKIKLIKANLTNEEIDALWQ